ncbi:hypothetical protein Tco_0866069 [Tanacetum coccineum]
MASFPCLEGLAMAANSRSLFDRMMLYFEKETSIDFNFAADLHNLWVQFIDCTNDRKLFISELDGLPPSVMSYNCCRFLYQVQENDFIKLLELRKMIVETYIYIERKIHEDLHFAVGLSNLWDVLYNRVNEHSLLIAELNVFGGLLALQCAEFFKQLSQTEVLKMLEIRKSIAEVHMQVHKKINFLTVMSQITKVDPPIGLFVSHKRSLFESDFVSLDPRLKSKKSAMDRSFTLGSTEEADNVKILQSCNGLLLCGGSGLPIFDYVYNLSTNQYKKLSYPDCSFDNSPYYTSAGLRIAFDPTKSSHYKLMDAGHTFCDIDIHIYSSEIGKWSLYSDRFNYFSFDHFDSAIYWNDG